MRYSRNIYLNSSSTKVALVFWLLLFQTTCLRFFWGGLSRSLQITCDEWNKSQVPDIFLTLSQWFIVGFVLEFEKFPCIWKCWKGTDKNSWRMYYFESLLVGLRDCILIFYINVLRNAMTGLFYHLLKFEVICVFGMTKRKLFIKRS